MRRNNKNWIWIIIIILIVVGFVYAVNQGYIKSPSSKCNEVKKLMNSNGNTGYMTDENGKIVLISDKYPECFDNAKPKVSYQFVSIKDLTQNPQDYIGKSVSIYGDLIMIIDDLNIQDKQGYKYKLTGNCLDSNRRYAYLNYNNPEQTGVNPTSYTAKGIIQENGSLFCDIPLE